MGKNGPMQSLALRVLACRIELYCPCCRITPSMRSTHPRLWVLNPVATLSLKWVDHLVDVSMAALLPSFVCGSHCARLVALTPRESGAVWLIQTRCRVTGSTRFGLPAQAGRGP